MSASNEGEPPTGARRPNFARDLGDPDAAIRAAASSRYPEVIRAGFRVAIRVLRHEEDALDVVADVLCRWLKCPSMYTDRYYISDLMFFRIAVRNTARNLRRARVNALERQVRHSAKLLDQSASREVILELREALARLEGPHRELLQRYVDSDNPPPVHRAGAWAAGALGVSGKTGKARLMEAVEALGRELEESSGAAPTADMPTSSPVDPSR